MRLIPPYLAPEHPSPGERFLFARLKHDPGASDWVVFHSVGIARHGARLAGEIDFVVVIPGEGVLCLEIKAGSVARTAGEWVFGSGPGRRMSPVGPFRQAADGMHALRRFLSTAEPELGKLLFFSGVIFTDSDFDESSPEWHHWQFAGRSDLDRAPVSAICRQMLHQAHQLTRSTPSARWYDRTRSRPDARQVAQLITLLRPDFEYPASPRVATDLAEKEILRFTEEQFVALDVLEVNPRVLYSGPAGTGKTSLALEATRRASLGGNPVLLTCFNRLLGQWLEANALPGPNSASFTGTFHSLLLRLSGIRIPPEPSGIFWSDELPEAVVDRALGGVISAPLFSFLCIDEAQDLIRPRYLDVMDLLLEGGLGEGRWAMFGDFENQAIYSRGTGQGRPTPEIPQTRITGHFAIPLRTNCRNSPQIAAGIELASGLTPGYSRVLQTADGPDVEVVFDRSQADSIETLEKRLTGLLEQFRPEEIVVLSPREDDSSTAGVLASTATRLPLVPLRRGHRRSGNIGYTTVHAFKGLESTVVVMIDITHLSGPEARTLLYVGMSRARVQLILHMYEPCRKEWLRLVQHGLRVRAAHNGGGK